MNKAFEKILERLEELHERYVNQYGVVGGNPMAFSVKECMLIVQEVAEEYNNGWIPCSVDLPKEKDGIVLICCEDGNVMTGKHSEFSDTWYKGNVYAVGGSNVIAWQPLPKPFKESD